MADCSFNDAQTVWNNITQVQRREILIDAIEAINNYESSLYFNKGRADGWMKKSVKYLRNNEFTRDSHFDIFCRKLVNAFS